MIPAQDDQAPTGVRWRMLALLMGLCLISHLNRAAMPVAGNDRIMRDYGIDETTMGAIYSAFLLVYSICMIPGGLFIDWVGPRRALMAVGFGSAVFGVLTGLSGLVFTTGTTLLLALIVIRGTMGLVSAPLHPAAARAVGNWFPFAQRSWANGLVTAAAIGGVALSYPGFGALIKLFHWQWAFVICAGATVILALVWTATATDTAAEHPTVNEAEKNLVASGVEATPNQNPVAFHWSGLLTNRSLLLVTLSYAAVGYFQYLFVYWMQFYLEKELHVEATHSKYYASIPQVALAAGMPLGGLLSSWLVRRLGVRWGRALVSGGGMALSATCLGLGVLSKDPAVIVFWLALAHAAIGAAEGPIWASAVDIGGEKGGTAAAICNTGGNVGGLLAPVVTPWIGLKFGWVSGLGLGGVICFLGALCWCWIDPSQRSRSTAHENRPVV